MKVGHRVLEVNGQSILGSTHDEGVKCVRAAGENVSLLVCYGFDEEDLVGQDDVSYALPYEAGLTVDKCVR